MRHHLTSVLTAAALVAAGSAMIAAPGQTVRPGEMTQARVWVQNRDPQESIPVSLQEASRDLAPLRVRVVNMQTSSQVDEPVRTRPVPQPWMYRTVVIPAGSPVLNELNQLGADGWETSGIQFADPDGGTALLLKRPR